MQLATWNIFWLKFKLTLPNSTAGRNCWLIYSMLLDSTREYHHRCVCMCVHVAGNGGGWCREGWLYVECMWKDTGSVVMLHQRFISTLGSVNLLASFLRLWLQTYSFSASYGKPGSQCEICYWQRLCWTPRRCICLTEGRLTFLNVMNQRNSHIVKKGSKRFLLTKLKPKLCCQNAPN